MYLLTYQGICISLALPAFFPSSFQLRELGYDLYPLSVFLPSKPLWLAADAALETW